SVDLPVPFGPMIAATSPSWTVSVSPSSIFRSPMETWRFLISSMSNPVLVVVFKRAAFQKTSAHAPFERDRDQLLRFDRELHRQLLQHVPHEAVDDQRRRLLRRKPPLRGVEKLVFRDF